jgi:hypothetical protein
MLGGAPASLWGKTSESDSKRDVSDILDMRFNGDFYAACETRWSMIHVDQLVLDQRREEVDSVTMRRVTDRYWKEFVYRVNVSLEMFGLVIWKIREEEVYCGDDPVRKAKFGRRGSDRARVKVPYVLDWSDCDVRVDFDDEDRVEVEATSRKTGKPIKDIMVSRGRRGGPRRTGGGIRFDTDCGSALEAWRRFRRIQAMHDEVAARNAAVVPFLEHAPINDSVRLQDGVRKVESLQHPVDKYGFEVEKAATLVKVDPVREEEREHVLVPQELRLAAVQPRPIATFDLTQERRALRELYASVLQLPIRYVMQETRSSLHTDSRAAVDEDMIRTVNAVTERRNEIVDIVKEAYFVCYEDATPNVHLPAKKTLRVENMYELYERGFMTDQVVMEEISAMTGIRLERFATPHNVSGVREHADRADRARRVRRDGAPAS